MRRGIWLLSILLPLSGCYMAPSDAGYGYAQSGPPQGYPPAGYAASGYPPGGYVPPPYDPNAGGYPGYSYNGGAPVIVEGGMSMPLVLYGGEWGFYDRDRRWHHAPEGVSHDLEAHRGGRGQYHPDAVPRGEPYPQPRPNQLGGQAAFRPAEPPRPNATPPVAPRQAQAGPPQVQHEHGRECPPGQHC